MEKDWIWQFGGAIGKQDLETYCCLTSEQQGLELEH
jgi:hypothetical protein